MSSYVVWGLSAALTLPGGELHVGQCDGPRFENKEQGPPVWCGPMEDYQPLALAVTPAVPIRFSTDRKETQVDESFLADVVDGLAPYDTAWRSRFFESTEQYLPAGFAKLEADDWEHRGEGFTAGIRDTVELPVGKLQVGQVECSIVGTHTHWRFELPCFVSADATVGELRLFPARNADAVVQVSVPFRVEGTPMPDEQAKPSYGWMTGLGIGGIGGGLLGFLLGRRRSRVSAVIPTVSKVEEQEEFAPIVVLETAEPPAVIVAVRAIEASPDPEVIARTFAEKQKEEVVFEPPPPEVLARWAQLPHLRLLLSWIAHHDQVVVHDERVSDLVVSSRGAVERVRSKRPPRGWLTSWESLMEQVELHRTQLLRLRAAVGRLLDGDVVAFDSETLSAWRTFVPEISLSMEDKGASAAADLRLGLMRYAISPSVSLAQLQFEALLWEIPSAGRQGDEMAEYALHTAGMSEALGYRYEHVALYGHSAAEFQNEFVELAPIRRQDLLHGLPLPPGAANGVICRVTTPLFRAVAPGVPEVQARFLTLRM